MNGNGTVPVAFPTVMPTGVPGANTVVLPDNATLERSFILYPSLLLFSILLYYALKTHYPWLYVLTGARSDTELGDREVAGTERRGLLGAVWYLISRKILVVFAYTEEELLEKIGVDQFVVLRLLKLMVLTLLGHCVVGLLFLLPVYQSHRYEPGSQCDQVCTETNSSNPNPYAQHTCLCDFIDRSSLANLQPHGELLWSPVVAMYVFTLWSLWLLRREYKNIIRVRNLFWMTAPPQLYTVLVDEIPSHLQLTSQKQIFKHFDAMFPTQVVKVDVVGCYGSSNYTLKALRSLGKWRSKLLTKLHRAFARLERSGVRPQHHEWSCKGRVQVDSIECWQKQLRKANEDFVRARRKFEEQNQEPEDGQGEQVASAAFVTLKSARASAVAVQTLIHERKNMVVVAAVEPSNVRWESLGYSEASFTCNRYLAQVVFFALLLVWGSLVTAISLATSSSALGDQFPWLKELMDQHTELKSWIDMAAPLVIIGLVALVNPLVQQLAKLYARYSETEVENVATMWYFVFLVIQIFIFYGVSKNLWSSLKAILESPRTIFSVLAKNIPQNAAFYMDFIVTKFFSMLAMDLLRVTSFFQALLRRLCCGADLSSEDIITEKCGCNAISQPIHINIGPTSAQLLLVYFIAITYLAIQPLIAPIALTFLVLAYLIYGTIFINVSRRRYDSGGSGWPIFYWCMMSALFASQGTLFGVMVLKQAYAQLVPLWVLIFFTAGTSSILNTRYYRLVTNLPLSIATAVDQKADDGDVRTVPACQWQYNKLTMLPQYLQRSFSSADGVSGPVCVYDFSMPILQEPLVTEVPDAPEISTDEYTLLEA